MRRAAMSALARRRQSGEQRGDLLGQMLAARDPETGTRLSDEELRDNIVTFIAAGHETTAVALTWTLYLIANDAETQQRLVEEVRSVAGDAPLSAAHVEQLVFHEQVIKEAMRLYPPVALLQRRAVRDVDLGPVSLNAGEEAVCLIYCMHRNKRVWDQPEFFIPERFAPETSSGRHRFAYMPFGGGPRICIGMKFAYLEAAAILASLVRRLHFAPNPAHPIKPILRVTMRPQGGMPLYVSPRA
jgi:cytochrome P450